VCVCVCVCVCVVSSSFFCILGYLGLISMVIMLITSVCSKAFEIRLRLDTFSIQQNKQHETLV